MIHRIVVLADASPESEQALLEAVNIGRIYHSIITCVHPLQGHDELSLNVSRNLRARAEEIVASTGLGFEWREGEGKAGHAIVKAALALGADLAVIGSLGEEGVARHLVTSAVEYAVRKAPCNVLVVKRGRGVF